jgi:hypothetical protein
MNLYSVSKAINSFAITMAGASGTAVNLKVFIPPMALDIANQTIHFLFVLSSSTGAVIQRGTTQLTVAQYQAWKPGSSTTSDGTYFLTCCAANLGLVLSAAV